MVEEVFVCMFKFIENEKGSLLTFNHHSKKKKNPLCRLNYKLVESS